MLPRLQVLAMRCNACARTSEVVLGGPRSSRTPSGQRLLGVPYALPQLAHAAGAAPGLLDEPAEVAVKVRVRGLELRGERRRRALAGEEDRIPFNLRRP